MSCIKRISRMIMVAAVLAALVAATVPVASAAPSADRPAAADRDSGWATLLSPWRALERWLGNVIAADEGGGGEPPLLPPPPICPTEQNPGPCSDPGG